MTLRANYGQRRTYTAKPPLGINLAKAMPVDCPACPTGGVLVLPGQSFACCPNCETILRINWTATAEPPAAPQESEG